MSEQCPECSTNLLSVGEAHCPQCGGDLAVLACPSDENRQLENSGHRPFGVSLLAGFYFLSGSLGTVGLIARSLQIMASSTSNIRFGPQPLSHYVLLAFLGTVGGYGMWYGRSWGWGVGAFYFFDNIARNIVNLASVVLFGDKVDVAGRGLGYFFMLHGFSIVVGVVLLTYFFKHRVLWYFRLHQISKPLVALQLLGMALAFRGTGIVSQFLAR